MLAPMLATIHNLHYYLQLVREIRDALDACRFDALLVNGNDNSIEWLKNAIAE